MDPATIDLITRLIGNLGFPIFVAIWLLFRTDKLLQELLKLLTEVRDTLNHRITLSQP